MKVIVRVTKRHVICHSSGRTRKFFCSLGTLFLNQRSSFLLQPGVRHWTIAFLQLFKMYDERSRLRGTLKYAVDRFNQANYQIWSSIALLPLDRLRADIGYHYQTHSPTEKRVPLHRMSYAAFLRSAFAHRCSRANLYALDDLRSISATYSLIVVDAAPSSIGNPMTRSIGILTSRPRNNLFGENPVELCGVARYVASTRGTFSSQSRCDSRTDFANIEFNVLWNLVRQRHT